MPKREEAALPKARTAPGELPAFSPGEEKQMREALLFMLEDLERQRLQVEEAHQEWQQALDSIRDPIFLHDASLNVMRCNRAFRELCGLGFKEIIGRSYVGSIPGATRPFDNCTAAGTEQQIVIGSDIYINRAYPIADQEGSLRFCVHVFENITAQIAAQRQLEILNRNLLVISRCNEVLVQAKDEHELLQRICDTIMEHGDYRAVWVSRPDEARDGILRMAASAGDTGAVSTQYDELDTAAFASCPIVVSLRQRQSGQIRSVKDSEACRTLCPRFAGDLDGTLIVLPLLNENETVGVMNILTNTPVTFAEEVMSLFRDLSDDMAYGIAVLHTRQQFEAATEKLLQNEQMLGKITSSAHDAIIMIDSNGNVIFWNPAAEKTFGYSAEEALGESAHRLLVPAGLHERAEKGLRHFMRSGEGPVIGKLLELTAKHKNGREIPIELTVSAVQEGNAWNAVAVVRDVSERRDMLTKLRSSLLGTIHAISKMVEARDPYTSGHEERVAELAVAIGEEMGIEADRLEGVKIAALVHDIGKIRIPSEILTVPRKLTPLEREMVETHPETGYEILKEIPFPWPVAEIVRQHHEKMDGSGYPRGLKGEEILLEAKIICVADVVEAMASHRPYREGLGIDSALAEIKAGKGHLYDPGAADACLHLFDAERFAWKIGLPDG